MNVPFSSQLKALRKDARLTNNELARLADVPTSLISGLQTGKRQIGEYQARKIALALDLCGEEFERFVYAAINDCTEKVLNESKSYPAELLNLLARQLRGAGICADFIRKCTVNGDHREQAVTLHLGNGDEATLTTLLKMA